MATKLTKSGLNKQDFKDPSWHLPLNSGFDDLEARLGPTSSGDPNGSVAGSWQGQLCWDSSNDRPFVCETTGVATAASWQRVYAGAGGGWLGIENVLLTSATEITGIPDGVREIVLGFRALSLTGNDNVLVQAETGGNYKQSGYSGVSSTAGNSNGSHSSGIFVQLGTGVDLNGSISLWREGPSSLTWYYSGIVARLQVPDTITIAGYFDMSSDINGIRLVTTGSDTFDSGHFSLCYR